MRKARRETGAEGYAFFRRDPDSTNLVRQDAAGIDIPGEAASLGVPGIVTYELANDGILAFVYQDVERSWQVQPRLDRIVPAIQSVWTAAHTTARYSELASQVAELEVPCLP